MSLKSDILEEIKSADGPKPFHDLYHSDRKADAVNRALEQLLDEGRIKRAVTTKGQSAFVACEMYVMVSGVVGETKKKRFDNKDGEIYESVLVDVNLYLDEKLKASPGMQFAIDTPTGFFRVGDSVSIKVFKE